jgi:glutamate-1-semialdehyde 2,1-aminomutase
MSRSQELFERAARSIPGGVNSPVRAFRAVGGTPVFIREGFGGRIRDVDGKEYIDLVGSWGPLILGHRHPEVEEAVSIALRKGTTFGAPTEAEVILAEMIVECVPSIERVRLVSSGTEACMSAVRLARAFTQRDGIVKFDGCYHGHGDSFLVRGGSGALTFGTPSSPGVPTALAGLTTSLSFNDLDGVRKFLGAHPKEIAAVIVEPIVGNMGVVPPKHGFLEGLLALCESHGALLILDEVMTGFRVARGGAQDRYGIRPHLTTLGKVVGGGLPLAAYGGRAEIMDRVAPLGPVYQAGTLSGNPLATAAGIRTLEILGRPGAYEKLEVLGRRLEDGIAKATRGRRLPLCFQRVGSMATLFFAPGPVHCLADLGGVRTDLYGRFFHGLLARGIYFPPSQYEAFFLSLAHTEADMDAVADAVADVLDELARET